MKFNNVYSILPAILMMIGVCACYELDNDYSTSSSHRLGFSSDTVTFDTVFTSIGSATRKVMIYNYSSNALLIRNIRLENSNSPVGFRFNVDGRSGSSFSDIRIDGNDSLFVFVEVTVDPTNNNLPVLIEDRMEFTVNNSQQYIVLQAYGQDVVKIKGGCFVKNDTTWSADRPYLIYDSVVVDSGVRLKIEPGAMLYMHDKAKWVINGSISAAGKLDKPIVFRGDRLDYALEKIPYDRMAGLWGGLYFSSKSLENEFDYVTIKNGNNGISCQESQPDKSKIRITNSQITNMAQSVLDAVNWNIEAVNTEFSNTLGAVVSLTGGNAEFIHCTLANFYRLYSGRLGVPVLCLSNFITETNGDKKGMDLQKASFANCIIDGNFSEGVKPLEGELKIDKIEDFGFNFFFNNCAIKTKETEDPSLVAIRFIKSNFAPQYKHIGEWENGYFYDFRPEINVDEKKNPLEKQPVVWQADTVISNLYPYDRLGIPRTGGDKAPDIGAYEHVNDSES